jgi:hypothetical protein
MSVVLPLDQMTLPEKLQLMEDLWSAFRLTPAPSTNPPAEARIGPAMLVRSYAKRLSGFFTSQAPSFRDVREKRP